MNKETDLTYLSSLNSKFGKTQAMIIELQQENKQLKSQLEYLRSGEYINQLRFERDMLQDLVDKGEISKEDKKFIDCTHRNTELLEELEEEKRINVEDLKTIDRQQEIIQELKADYGNKAQVERDMLRIEASARETVTNELQQKIEKTITGIDILMEIIKEQPTENALDDIYILDKLNGFKKSLKGDSNE